MTTKTVKPDNSGDYPTLAAAISGLAATADAVTLNCGKSIWSSGLVGCGGFTLTSGSAITALTVNGVYKHVGLRSEYSALVGLSVVDGDVMVQKNITVTLADLVVLGSFEGTTGTLNATACVFYNNLAIGISNGTMGLTNCVFYAPDPGTPECSIYSKSSGSVTTTLNATQCSFSSGGLVVTAGVDLPYSKIQMLWGDSFGASVCFTVFLRTPSVPLEGVTLTPSGLGGTSNAETPFAVMLGVGPKAVSIECLASGAYQVWLPGASSNLYVYLRVYLDEVLVVFDEGGSVVSNIHYIQTGTFHPRVGQSVKIVMSMVYSIAALSTPPTLDQLDNLDGFCSDNAIPDWPTYLCDGESGVKWRQYTTDQWYPGAVGGTGYFYVYPTGADHAYMTLVNCSLFGGAYVLGTLSLDYCCTSSVLTPQSGGTVTQTHNLFSTLTNAYVSDNYYFPKNGLIEGGTNTGVTPDILGVSRPQRTLYDIGAFEAPPETPATVGTPVVVPTSPTSIRICWIVSSGAVASQVVQLALDSGFTSGVQTVTITSGTTVVDGEGPGSTCYTFGTLTPGTPYYLRVKIPPGGYGTPVTVTTPTVESETTVNEITLQVSLVLTRIVELANWSPGANVYPQTGTRFNQTLQNVQPTAALLQLGAVGTPGYLMLQNKYTGSLTSNIIYILTATNGSRVMQLDINEVAVLKLGPDLTAPAVKAALTTASDVPLEVLVFEL